MIGCYLDESFDPSKAGVFAVGGLIGRGVPFFELERKWQQLRRRSNIDIAYFKSSECQMAKREFSKFAADPRAITPFERNKLDAIRDEFLDLIVAEQVVGFGVGVKQDDFYEVIQEDAARAILGETPYWFAYHAAMIEAAFAMKKLGMGDAVAFVCDEHEQHSRLAPLAYKELRERNPNAAKYLGSFSSADDHNCEPLQAADAIIFEIRRALHVSFGLRQEAIRPQFNRLAKTMWMIQYADAKYLRSVVQTNMAGQPLNLDHFLEQEFPEDIKF